MGNKVCDVVNFMFSVWKIKFLKVINEVILVICVFGCYWFVCYKNFCKMYIFGFFSMMWCGLIYNNI